MNRNHPLILARIQAIKNQKQQQQQHHKIQLENAENAPQGHSQGHYLVVDAAIYNSYLKEEIDRGKWTLVHGKYAGLLIPDGKKSSYWYLFSNIVVEYLMRKQAMTTTQSSSSWSRHSCEVIYKDGNPLNNTLSNLAIKNYSDELNERFSVSPAEPKPDQNGQYRQYYYFYRWEIPNYGSNSGRKVFRRKWKTDNEKQEIDQMMEQKIISILGFNRINSDQTEPNHYIQHPAN